MRITGLALIGIGFVLLAFTIISITQYSYIYRVAKVERVFAKAFNEGDGYLLDPEEVGSTGLHDYYVIDLLNDERWLVVKKVSLRAANPFFGGMKSERSRYSVAQEAAGRDEAIYIETVSSKTVPGQLPVALQVTQLDRAPYISSNSWRILTLLLSIALVISGLAIVITRGRRQR